MYAVFNPINGRLSLESCSKSAPYTLQTIFFQAFREQPYRPGILSDGMGKRQKIGLIHRKTHLPDSRSFDTIKLFTVCLSTTVVSADAEPGCNGMRFRAGLAEGLWVDRPTYDENLQDP